MKRSTERILTTHAGSLTRPADLLEMVRAKDAGDGFANLGSAAKSARDATVSAGKSVATRVGIGPSD